jgi:predicted dehydrogenase
MVDLTTPKPVRVGVVGLGMMGRTHLDCYAKMPGVEVVAVADRNAERRSGRAAAEGNIDGQAMGSFDLASDAVAKYADAADLIADEAVDVVDICVPTPGHQQVGLAALAADKHTIIEKPLARTHTQAVELADAAEAAWERAGVVSMCAMCMRFWPGWQWLAEAVADGRFGRVTSASFRRVASFPGGGFYGDGEASGGALLDLHIHDLDFIRHAFAGHAAADEIAVSAAGYTQHSGEIDHILTRLTLPPGAANVSDKALVYAEGSWTMTPSYPFTMRYTVTFDLATADFDLARDNGPLRVYADGKESTPALPDGMGYEPQLEYFVKCVRLGEPAAKVTLRDAAESVALAEMVARAAR